ncbi:hypothetical protein [Asinibacterium sp. OR53]|uniref:hypothetical protein n=1 Tax=Asinibacterium sp. OR53 TaxID=925409 RepID=UPI00047C47BC|nr:hypothetical protein [Asinibacterium sp. OR53]
MKKIYVLISGTTLLCCFLLMACSTSRNVQQEEPASKGSWQANKLVIDGNDSDWTAPLRFEYNKKEKFSYAVTNDQTHLYVLLRSNDENTQQEILRGGLTVLFNAHAVSEERGAAGIVYPTGNIPKGPMNGKQEYNNNKHIALNNAQDYSLFGFNTVKSLENYDYGKENKEGIQVSVGFNAAGELVYETAVPFTALFNRNSAVNQGGRSLSVGFIIDPIPTDPAARGGRRGPGVAVGGGFGFGGYGSGGGIGISIGTGGFGGGRQRMPKSTRVWREIILAKAQ